MTLALTDKDISVYSFIHLICLSLSDKNLKNSVPVLTLPTSALRAVVGPATMPVVGVEHGDVATLVLQIHVLLQLLQRLVHAHVGVGELCTGSRQHTLWDTQRAILHQGKS